jgi:phosphotriesterase-related protein
MSGIDSVTGPVAGADLGFVLVHEHVAASSPGIISSWPELCGGRQGLIDLGVRALRAARAAGVTTIVDCTTFDLGRDAALLAEVSRASGVTIIGSTGLWLDPPVTLRARSADQLAERFERDLTEGMDGTPIRAGVIKVASEERVEPFAELVLAAAARASRATSAPIITHTAARHRTGEQQADLLESFGADPRRVAIGHSDDSADADYLSGLAARGYRIAMDRLPNGALEEYGGQTVADRIDMIAELVQRGYGDRVLLAHDDPVWAGLLTDTDQARHQAANPDGLAFVARVVLPALERRGVPPETIRQLTVDNPRQWLTAP